MSTIFAGNESDFSTSVHPGSNVHNLRLKSWVRSWINIGDSQGTREKNEVLFKLWNRTRLTPNLYGTWSELLIHESTVNLTCWTSTDVLFVLKSEKEKKNQKNKKN